MAPDAFAAEVERLLQAGVSRQDTRLIRLTIPYLADLEKHGTLKALCKVARKVLKEDDAEEQARAPRIPQDWPHLNATRGMVACIAGGEPREPRRAVLQEEFGFEELTWVKNPKNHLREMDGLIERIRSGSIDVVIVVRAFVPHTASNRFFEHRDKCRVVLADTYGVTQIQRALERALG